MLYNTPKVVFLKWDATLKTIPTILRIFADQITCQWQFYSSNFSCRMQIACLNAHLDLAKILIASFSVKALEEYTSTLHHQTSSNITSMSGVHPGAGRGVAQWRNTFTFLRCRGLAARPAVSSDHGRYLTSHMRGAGPTIAHTGTLMMHWQRPPHPSHRSCSVQFILMLIHAIDCGVEPGQWTRRSWGAPHVVVSVWVSSVSPPPLSTLSWSRQFGAHLKFYDICYSAPYLPICTPIKLSFGDVGVNLSCCCVRVTARWPVLLLPHKLWTV